MIWIVYYASAPFCFVILLLPLTSLHTNTYAKHVILTRRMYSSEQTEANWKPPVFAFDHPKLASRLCGKDIAPLTGSSSDPSKYFWRNVAWSPDGTHLLAQSDDHHLNLFKLQDSFYLEHLFSVYAPTTLLSFAWYPFARQDDPQTWCFAMGARDVTIKLIDAYQGLSRATYGIIDHTERFKGPQSIAFSLDGRFLYCAHDSFLSIVSLDKPGINTHFSIRLTPSARATRKGKAPAGQRGIISTITVTSDHLTGSKYDLVAIGTFAGTVGIYQIKEDLITDVDQLCVLGWREDGSNGIAQISFHPTVPHLLFVTSRRDSTIRAYDLRYIGSRPSFVYPPAEVAVVGIFDRQDLMESKEKSIQTQQRIHFHLDWAGRYLISGNTEGVLYVWDIESPESELRIPQESIQTRFFGRILRKNEDPFLSPLARWKAAEDAIPAVALHPKYPIVVVASGSRSWNSDIDSEGDDEAGEDDQSLSYTVPDASLSLFKTSSNQVV